MRAVGVHEDAVFVGGIEGVAGDVRAPIDDMDAESRIGEDARGRGAREAAADHQRVDDFHDALVQAQPARRGAAAMLQSGTSQHLRARWPWRSKSPRAG
jgi:hypothetical protein